MTQLLDSVPTGVYYIDNTAVINNAISSIAMFAMDTNMSNIEKAISHVKTVRDQLAREVGEEVASHFEIVAFKILNRKV